MIKRKVNKLETFVHGVFLILGIITVAAVLLITVFLLISGIPAIKEIGFVDFFFGQKWAPTFEDPSYGILPFILTSVYGTAGAIILGTPAGFFTAVYLSKIARPGVRRVMETAVNLLPESPLLYTVWSVCSCWFRPFANCSIFPTDPVCWQRLSCWRSWCCLPL